MKRMKKMKKKLLSMLLALVTVVTFLGQIPPHVFGLNDVLTLNWAATGETHQALKPGSNVKQEVRAQLVFSPQDLNTYQADEIEIRLPKSIFKKRDGTQGDTIAFSISDTPAGETGFWYQIEGDEVVIKNFREFVGSNSVVINFSYTYLPSEIANGYTKDNIKAVATYNSKIETTKPLSLELTTGVSADTVIKQFQNKFEVWNPNWGTQPIDSADYYYVSYILYGRYGKLSTQEMVVKLVENPQNGGEIVAWTTSGNADNNWTAGNTTDFNNSSVASKQVVPNPTISTYTLYARVIVKYPRTEKKVTNKVTFVAQGLDANTESKQITNTYTYQNVDFSYIGDQYLISKSMDTQGTQIALNMLDTHGEVLLEGYGMDMGKAGSLNNTSRGYSTTNGGKDPFVTSLTDDLVYLKGTDGFHKLNREDYEFTSAYITTYEEKIPLVDPNLGLTGQIVANDKRSPIDIYYKTRDNSDWQFLDTYQPTSSYYSPVFHFPSGTTEIKAEHTNGLWSVNFNFQFKMKLFNTQHVKGIVGEQTSIELHNFGNLQIFDQQGAHKNSVESDSYLGDLKEEIKQFDLDTYKHYVQRATAKTTLRKAVPVSYLNKTVTDTISDTVTSTEISKIELSERNSLYGIAFTIDELATLGVLPEQKEGVFYDLLPKGAFIDTSSLKAKNANDKDVPFTYFLTENYKGSGRTLLEVHVTNNTQNNYYIHGTQVRTGFNVYFDMHYPWLSIGDYGPQVKNIAAYQTKNGVFSDGYNDDPVDYSGFTDIEKDWMFDLDKNNNPDAEQKDTIYSFLDINHNGLTATEVGYRKTVKTANDLTYKEDTQVLSGESYHYRLRYQNGSQNFANHLVMYEVLEENYGTNNYWKGTFESIDVSNLVEKGINPIVYYSTRSDLDPTNNSSHANLADTSIWTKTEPSNKADIKAIAIDSSNKTDGNAYRFEPEESATVYVHMTAPNNFKDYTNPNLKAYNKSAYRVDMTMITGGSPIIGNVTDCNGTTVEMLPREVKINKTSNVPTGTKTDPTEVAQGSELTYNLQIKNEEQWAVKDIVAQDTIPTHMTFDPNQLKGYFGTNANNAVLLHELQRIEFTVTGNKIQWKIDMLQKNEEFHLLVPVKVANNLTSETIFENTATLTDFNGISNWNINSETLYHKVVTRNLRVVKAWDDDNNRDKVRGEVVIQLKADNTPVGPAVPLNEYNYWTHLFTNLPKHKDGVLITYSIEETKTPDGYTPSYKTDQQTGEITITNTRTPETTSYTVKKEWMDHNNYDGSRPNRVTVQLTANGSPLGNPETLDDSNNWQKEFTDLYKYENGVPIVYSVVEINPPAGYTTSYNTSGTTIIVTNSHTPQMTSYTVQKLWADDNNRDNLRPTEVEIQLLANGTPLGNSVVLSENNNWRKHFTDLYEYDKNGTPIVYSVVEMNPPTGYTSSYSTSDTTITVTNTHTIQTVGYSVKKLWNDNDDKAGKRPSKINVQLLANGEKKGGVITLNKENNWTKEILNLPKNENGVKIAYSVAEVEIPNNYQVSYSKKGTEFTVTNTYVTTTDPVIPPGPTDPTTPINPADPNKPSPTTGDTSSLPWAATLFLFSLGTITILLYKKKQTK